MPLDPGGVGGIATPELEVGAVAFDGLTHSEKFAALIRTMASHGSSSVLGLGKAQYGVAVGIIKIVGDNDEIAGGAEVLGRVCTVTDVAPCNPRPRAAGELAIAKVQPPGAISL
jgi:hypothetical protein